MPGSIKPDRRPGADSPRRRGRPPSIDARNAILRAARELLAEGGPAAVTMEGVAARAGVGKPTVYRWWPDRHAVAMAALMEVGPEKRDARRPRTAEAALRQQLHAIVSRFSTPVGRHVTAMLAAADPGSELARAFQHHFVLARRAEGRDLLRQVIATDGAGADPDIDVAVDLLYGALFFRLLLGHAPLDAGFADKALDQTLRALRSGRSGGAHGRRPAS